MKALHRIIFFLLLITWLGYNEPLAQALDEPLIETTEDVDVKRKETECEQLTQNAVKHFMKVSSVASACSDFIRDSVWRKGELFVFVVTEKGRILAHGDDYHLLWESMNDVKGVGGAPVIKDMLSTGEKGGWISYLWNNGYKASYVKTVKKNKLTYLIGVGFFPENDRYATKQVVKIAIDYFLTNGPKSTFALISNPKGPFVRGDIYMFVLDFEGVYQAHGQNAALVGQNLSDTVDTRGKPLIKEILNVAKTKGSGWVDYYWRNEYKLTYVEKVIDPKTKTPYVFCAGYYPNVTLETVKSYVARAITYLKANGSKIAFAEFSNLVGEFAQGGLGIFVFDLKGNCLANGENPSFVGQNLMKITSEHGRFYYKEMVEQAQKYGKALISYTNFNANALAYVEFVDTPDGKFVIGAEFFPASKTASTQSLVSQALEFIQTSSLDVAFETFSEPDNVYLRGDLYIFIYDTDGVRFINGTQKTGIWKNLLKTTDQTGKAVVSDMITVARNGGGWVEYKVRNATRKVYVKMIKKLVGTGVEKEFVVGSGFFL